MELDFTGKVALITGAGNGIGRATALAFGKSGAKVVVVDRDTAGGEATAGIIRQQGGEARFVAADVTRSAEVRAYVQAALDAYRAIHSQLDTARHFKKVFVVFGDGRAELLDASTAPARRPRSSR